MSCMYRIPEAKVLHAHLLLHINTLERKHVGNDGKSHKVVVFEQLGRCESAERVQE